ncbi:MAG: choice-of-anchor D domain-containing protein [Alphaproteobacteria bacterium]|nr:choice-of-anchor D domain-containing protein [Alphaproteobacteria bacterium]
MPENLMIIMRSHVLKIILSGTFLAFCMLFAWGAAAQMGPAALSDPGSRQGATGAVGDGLIAIEPSVDGGAIPIGATAQVVVRFRNDGAQPVETGTIRLYPSSTVSATVSLDQCKEMPLTTGAECAIALSVKALQSGPWRVEMLMSHNGRTRLVTATLSGTVEAAAEGTDTLRSDVEAIPDAVDFGSLNASQTLVQPVILRNITSIGIDVTDIYIDASAQTGYSMQTECKRLEPGQACIATISWSPKLKGPATGVLVVKHSGPTALSSVIIKGEYVPDTVDRAEAFPEAVPGKGLLVSSQTEVDFGEDVQTASTITVSLVNAGDAKMTIDDILISGSDNGLSFRGKGCVPGLVLEPIEACPLTIYWAPTRAGVLLDDIQVVHDGARGILVLPVRGTATNAVSQDQGAIMLSGGGGTLIPQTPTMSSLPRLLDEGGEEYEIVDVEDDGSGGGVVAPTQEQIRRQQQLAASDNAPRARNFVPNVPNPSAVLDGLKITSFSPTRAIINGPSGSRIVFNNEPIVLGGIPWDVRIQRNGIEFTYAGQTVLLLFDRSLSSVNRVQSQSGSGTSGSSSSASSIPSVTSGGL